MADRYSIPVDTIFNRWTYLGQDHRIPKKGRVALFRCLCGTERVVNTLSVMQGRSKSCGCQRVDSARDLMTTHGMSQDGAGSAYMSWENMFSRCENPKSPAYKDYGGRGISVCERWRKFENFFKDMGERPPGTSIDRWPDKNGNYEPGNCRWATQAQQMYNTRQTISIEHDGRKLTTGDVAIECGVSADRVRYRVNHGMPQEMVTSAEKLNERKIEHGGFSMNMAEWTRHLGLNRGTIETRLRRGKSIEEALAPVQPRHRKK